MGQTKVKIASFGAYNQRRYSRPWVALLVSAKYVFEVDYYYTGRVQDGEAGDLVVIDPQDGQVYAYGQKDYRGGKTELKYAVYQGGEFVELSRAEAMAQS